MNNQRLLKTALGGSVTGFASLATLFVHSPYIQAQSQASDDESKIQQGFAIAPASSNLKPRCQARSVFVAENNRDWKEAV
jgi:hypothetical protein